MTRTGKIVVRVLQGLVALMSALLVFTFLMSDKLTRQEVAERIVAADEPCRAAYAKMDDLHENDPGVKAMAVEASGAASAGEPVCHAASASLDKIIIYIPRQAGDEARAKKAAIQDCAALSRARAALLAYFAGTGPPDAGELDALNAELVRSDEACKASYERLIR